MNWRNCFLFNLILLCSGILQAQAYIPGFGISSDGNVLVEIPTGHYSDLLHTEGFSSSDMVLDEIPADTTTACCSYFEQLAGNDLHTGFPAILPGFNTRNNALFNSFPYFSLYGFYGEKPKVKAHWDTSYYSTTSYFCNGGMAISSYQNCLHYTDENVPDSMLNGMNVYIEDSLHFIPKAGYRIFTRSDGLVDSIFCFMAGPDNDSYYWYPTARIDYVYGTTGQLQYLVSSTTHHSPRQWLDTAINKVEDFFRTGTNDEFSALSRWMEHEDTSRTITSLLAITSQSHDSTRILTYSCTSSLIDEMCIKGDINKPSQIAYANGNYHTLRYGFRYANDAKLRDIEIDMQYNESPDLNSLEKYTCHYNGRKELLGCTRSNQN
jgi:hypothetical protein